MCYATLPMMENWASNLSSVLTETKLCIFINTCSLNILCFASLYTICIKYVLVKVQTWINVWCVNLSYSYSVISQLCSSNQITMVLSRLRKWLSFSKELETHFISDGTIYFSVFYHSLYLDFSYNRYAHTHTSCQRPDLLLHFKNISNLNMLGKQRPQKQQKMRA